MSVPEEPFEPVEVLLQRLDASMPMPSYAHPGDAGADLMTTEDVVLPPGERRTVPTGVAIALPLGYAAFVHPRSGLAARSGLTVVNAPGTVDAGYRGEIRVTLLNTDREQPVELRRGDRIAQLVVQPVSRARFVAVERLPGSARGQGGFGSTGGSTSLTPPSGPPLEPPVNSTRDGARQEAGTVPVAGSDAGTGSGPGSARSVLMSERMSQQMSQGEI